MSNKSVTGIDLSEWNSLAGISDPYALNIAEARDPLADLPDNSDDAYDDEPAIVTKKAKVDVKKEREPLLKRRNRLYKKNMGAIRNAKDLPAVKQFAAKKSADRADHLAREVKALRKMGGKDESLEFQLWAAFLEDRGTTMEEFGHLLNMAIESNDDELSLELLAIEDQLDELLGAIGQGAMAAGKSLVKGAQTVGKGLVNGAATIGGAAVQGAKAGFGVAKPAAAPAAGGGAPAGATPPAGAPPETPAGASPQAAAPKPAVPAAAAAPAAPKAQVAGSSPSAPAGNPVAAPTDTAKKPGLLGTFARGVGKVAKGVAGISVAPAKAIGSFAKNVKAGYNGESVESIEAFLDEEFGLTAEQYIEMCDRAFAENDVDMIESANRFDEMFADWQASKAVAAPIAAESKLPVKKEETKKLNEDMKSFMLKQLQFSGYTDEHIDRKAKGN